MQARFVIEYSYVRLMSATKKQADRAIRDQLCLLALLADTLEKVRRFNAPCVVLLCYLPGAVPTVAVIQRCSDPSICLPVSCSQLNKTVHSRAVVTREH